MLLPRFALTIYLSVSLEISCPRPSQTINLLRETASAIQGADTRPGRPFVATIDLDDNKLPIVTLPHLEMLQTGHSLPRTDSVDLEQRLSNTIGRVE